MNYTDEQLKQTLAKMLPETVREDYGTEGDDFHLEWKVGRKCMRVLPTELLHLCWLVEETLDHLTQIIYSVELANNPMQFEDYTMWDVTHATWQQRTIALAKVKGIEIV